MSSSMPGVCALRRCVSLRCATVAGDASISVTFHEVADGSVDLVSSLFISGSQSGLHTFTEVTPAGPEAIAVEPDQPFLPGERVTAQLNDGIGTTDGTAIGG